MQQLAESRLQEAKILLANQLPDGALYLAGYALELALKARVCKILETDYPAENYRSFFTHKYNELVLLAGLSAQLDRKRTQDPGFNANWSLLIGSGVQEGWSENWRYRKIGSVSNAEAVDFIEALEDSQSGVLTWIKLVW
ncbi:MAG: hypothetical protein EOO60_12430 [Hymenobacter sp.]|nr:MAG: hypothetical protein EOO60_12430 [Hymenobacter sp.]